MFSIPASEVIGFKAALIPLNNRNILFPRRKRSDQLSFGIQGEGCTVENQFVLPAKLIEIDQRQAGFFYAVIGEFAARFRFSDFKRAAIRDEQNIRPCSFRCAAAAGVHISSQISTPSLMPRKDKVLARGMP